MYYASVGLKFERATDPDQVILSWFSCGAATCLRERESVTVMRIRSCQCIVMVAAEYGSDNLYFYQQQRSSVPPCRYERNGHTTLREYFI